MQSILTLIIVNSLLIASFLGWGKTINDFNKLNSTKFFEVALGFILFLGFSQFVIYFFVILKIDTHILFYLNFILLVLGILLFFSNRLNQKNKSYKKPILILNILSLLILLMLIFNRSLGQNSFDYLHYLSMIQEGSTRSFFGFIDYGTGYQTSQLNPQYDFQSYYHFGSFILLGFNSLLKFFASDYFPVSMHLVIWTLSIIYVLLNISLIYEIVSKIKSSVPVKVFIYLVFVFYFGFMYYNTSYAFFGNSYRSILVSYFIFEIYRSLNNHDKSLKNSVWLMWISSALISVSSSGFFIGIVILTPYILIFLKNSFTAKEKLKYVLVLTLQTVLFSAFYLSANQQAGLPWLILGASIIYGISTLFLLSENSIINLILLDCKMKSSNH